VIVALGLGRDTTQGGGGGGGFVISSAVELLMSNPVSIQVENPSILTLAPERVSLSSGYDTVVLIEEDTDLEIG
jgi:hypothetical protein